MKIKSILILSQLGTTNNGPRWPCINNWNSELLVFGKDFVLKATYIWQMAMATKGGRSVPSFLIFFCDIFFYDVFVFSTRGVQKHHTNFLGKIHVKNFWPKKLRKNKLFCCRLFPSIFFSSRFWPFLCMRSPKTP
jgi:hypothetical protein